MGRWRRRWALETWAHYYTGQPSLLVGVEWHATRRGARRNEQLQNRAGSHFHSPNVSGRLATRIIPAAAKLPIPISSPQTHHRMVEAIPVVHHRKEPAHA